MMGRDSGFPILMPVKQVMAAGGYMIIKNRNGSWVPDVDTPFTQAGELCTDDEIRCPLNRSRWQKDHELMMGRDPGFPI